MKRSFTIFCAIVMASLSLPAAVHADDQDVIAYRQHIMKALNEQTAAIGMIVSTAIPPDNAAAHLESIALLASTALKSFEAKVPGGEAKPEVWANWADFSKRMNEFALKTSAAAKTAKEQGAEEALTTVLDALPCKQCHDKYREEKKKK